MKKTALALLAVTLAGAGWWWFGGGSAYRLVPSSDQNVLLITIDTLRGDALSSYGGQAQTPNLDRLAAQGARFTFAHSHAVVTLPSHTTILTGHLPYEHGMRDNSGYRVKDGTLTLAGRLKALGYATGAFVGGFPLTKRFGLTPGFDVYDDQMGELSGDASFAMPERPANEVVTRANAWIAQQGGKFFGWVHVFDAHSPYRPPAEFASRYQAQPYYGEVAWIDQALGPLFDRLATLSRPTTVIVTADHGESLGDHGEATHGMFAYESTLHVPLIVATVTPQSSRAPKGVVVTTPARHIDIAPTVLDAIGASADTTLPGASLRTAIDGDTADRPAYFEAMTYNLVRGWAPLRGVLVAREKYIDLPIQELYDLATDPKEARNLAAAKGDRAQALFNTLKTFNLAPPNRPGLETAETMAQLKSLGYLSGSAPAKDRYTEADDPKSLASIDQELHTATALNQAGRTDDAIGVFKKVIARRPDTADAYMSLSYAYWSTGRVAEAIQTLEAGLRAGAPDRDLRIRLGIYLAESHTNAQRAIQVLTGLPDTDVEALNGLGIAHLDAKHYAEAQQAFTRVLALDPTNGLAYQNLATTALSMYVAGNKKDASKLDEAEAYLRKAIDADPQLAGAYTAFGVTMSYKGRTADAIDAWKRAVEIDPMDGNALYNLWFELAKANRNTEAMPYARQYLAIAPPSPERASIERWAGGR